MDRPSTGIDALDELLGGLGVGDNVVWQAAGPADIEPFVEAFLSAARGRVRAAAQDVWVRCATGAGRAVPEYSRDNGQRGCPDRAGEPAQRPGRSTREHTQEARCGQRHGL